MSKEAVLLGYEKVFSISESMLFAVQNSQWDALIGLEKDYSTLMEEIRARDFIPPDDIEFAKRKTELIRSILDNDAKIRAQVNAKLEDLQGAIASAGQAIKLNQAYRP